MKKTNLILTATITIGVLLLLGVGMGIWWKRAQPQPQPETLPQLPPLEISPTVPQPSAPIYTLEVAAPKVEKLPVYQYSFASTPASWARNLGFAGEPEEIEDALRGTLYLWTKLGRTLIVDKKALSLSYSVDLLADPETLAGSFLPTFEPAAAIVERTLLELEPASGGSPLLKLDPQKSKALKAGVARVREVSFEEADLVEIHFTAKVDDYPIYLESGPDGDPAVAWVGKDAKLLRLEYTPLGTVGEKIGEYPLWSAEEVLAMLERGEGVVVSSTLEGGQTIASATVTRIAAGYLLPPPDATVIQPVFVVSAKVTTTSGKTGEMTIYLPAIRSD